MRQLKFYEYFLIHNITIILFILSKKLKDINEQLFKVFFFSINLV